MFECSVLVIPSSGVDGIVGVTGIYDISGGPS